MRTGNMQGLDVEQLRFFETILSVRRKRGENITVNELISEYCQEVVIAQQKEINSLDDFERILYQDPKN